MQFSEFSEKVVFVTGANSGIGYAQAEAFLKQGATVFAIDIEENRLVQLKNTYGDTFDYVRGSVREKSDIEAAVQGAIEQFGRIDILLNTAGVLDGYAKTLETDEVLWDRVMDTNVKGTYHVTNVVLSHMLERKKGVIVNMASIAGFVAGGGGAAYTASKHAIIGYTKQLDYDYARDGIRANALAPGAIQTPMNQADFAGDGEVAKWVAEETPAGRWAKPEEVANLTLFIASEAADYIHGAVMPIDGGWTMK
ncbi:3-oxoacyl-ACP reductase [Oceanobacillus polygoni]|uniref:3-oxoacyl-[acyl-carrier protein] reductase n=1 Tax=Oceanobacillus polygoni TaxID=1235259 RepID=A0A9X0YWR8_9BACI|nr:3-oxoacyl-ACP reductase [Oceanobacillus polygoni]MBP2080074.1 3-oxoacyl-[acyl-carrier protein] reductase [Oceanobacillus polygoni]